MLASSKCLAVLFAAMLTCSIAAAQPKTDPATLEQSAKSFIDMLNKGDFAKATTSFDEAMLKAMPAEELKKTWDTLVTQIGAFKSQLSARTEKSGDHALVFVTCEFAKAKVDARVVFDKAGKVSGLFFNAAKEPMPEGAEEIWEGSLKVGPTDLRLVFHLFKQNDGAYLGTMDSPDQGASGIKLDSVTVKKDDVKLELKSAGVVFEGKLEKGLEKGISKKITGQFKQASQSFPLTLTRKTDSPKTAK
jgi:Protein of unknown function (DUF3887)